MNNCQSNYYTEIISGSMGSIGSQGFQGENGISLLGPQGQTGFVGAQGITGSTGGKGPTGSQGPQGNIGLMGPTGTLSQTGGAQGDYLYWNNFSGNWNVGSENIIIGKDSGKYGQNLNAISIGVEAGFFNQQQNSLAIGYQSGYNSQGACAISIGKESGKYQKDYAIAIGNRSGTNGFDSQINKSIILNATGNYFTNSFKSGLFVNPVRQKKYDPSGQNYQLYYNLDTKEIIFNLLTVPGDRKIIFNYIPSEDPFIPVTYQFGVPEGLSRFYVTAIGGGGGGSMGDGLTGGGGGGSGGSIYRYPIIFDLTAKGIFNISNIFVIQVGKGGDGANTKNSKGNNGQRTTLSYYTGDADYPKYILCGCGGGSGGVLSDEISKSGAGGSVGWGIAFFDVNPSDANYSEGVPASSYTPYPSPNGVLDQNGQSGKFIYSVVIGSSGGSGGTPLSLQGKNGGRANGFYTGGSGGNTSGGIAGGGGGASSILGKGGDGEIPFVSSATNGSYGAGGGGGTNNSGGNGGDGIVIIEW